ncbi:MAG: amino acid adenylation domain-containing protein [Nannocystaceae bacterium]
MNTSAPTEGFAPSLAQIDAWYLCRELGGAESAVQLVGELGDVDPEAVERAFSAVVAQNEILRTRLRVLSGMTLPVQVIGAAEESARVRRSDRSARDLCRAERDAVAEGAPARLAITRGGGLVLTFAAGSADTETAVLVVQELARRLEGPTVDDGPLQYADLSEWMERLGDEPGAEQAVAQWKILSDSLPGSDGVSSLQSPPDVGGGQLRSLVEVQLSTGLAASLAAASDGAGREEATLLGCWAIVAARRSGDQTVGLGVRSPGRVYDGLDVALGPLARDLPLLVELSEGETLSALADRIAVDLQAAREIHEYYGSHDLRAARLGWSFEYTHIPSPGATGLRIERVDASAGEGNYRLCVQRVGETVRIALRYDPQRSSDHVARFALDSYLQVLESGLRSSTELGCEAFELVAAAETEALRRLSVGVASPRPAGPRIEERIAERAKRFPDAVALVSADSSLTYRQLDRRANALAVQLQSRGVAPAAVVGVLAYSSIDAVVGILGVLKTGAGYVPLDPQHPPGRLRLMLDDARVPVVCVQRGVEPDGLLEGIEVVEIDDTEAVDPPVHDGQLDHLAYIIFTSGTTGRPKGVEISHSQLLSSTLARRQHYEQVPACYLAPSSFSFDSSVAGIYWTLLEGGTLVLPTEGSGKDPAHLAALIREHRVTTTLLLPSLLSLVLGVADETDLSSLRTVIVAGEACARSVVELQRKQLPHARLYNEYGPTEGTVWCSVYDCGKLPAVGPVPIGRPIPGAELWLLDPQQRLAPISAPAELWVGGAGVARGYLDRAELTKDRFVELSLVGSVLQRMYRTGDRVCWRADGDLDFLGRLDDQVKVRGHRIELGEVRRAVEALSGVRECAVVARTPIGASADDVSSLALVAYVVGDVALPELRGALALQLPDYMVPSFFVPMPKLPRTSNGKVHTQVLPEPDLGRADRSTAHVSPATALEDVVLLLWEELLPVDEIGVCDDFFELGGNSLVVAQLAARVGEMLQTDLPLRAVFDHPTIRGLAELLVAGGAEEARRLERIAAVVLECAESENEEEEQEEEEDGEVNV